MTSPQRLRALLLPLLALSACDVLSSRDAAPEASASAMTKASSDPQAARVVSPAADAIERAQQAVALPEPDAPAGTAPAGTAPAEADRADMTLTGSMPTSTATAGTAPAADPGQAPSPVMSTPPAFEPIVPRDATVQTVGALPCPEGTRQVGGAHPEHSALGLDMDMTYCVEWPIAHGAMPVRRGPAVWFHDDGSIEQQGHYEDRKRTGWWEKRHENGRLAALVHYRDGEYDGLYFTWWDDGQPQSEIEWRAGKHHGLSKTWGDDGVVLAVSRYEDDRKVELWMYDAEGKGHRM